MKKNDAPLVFLASLIAALVAVTWCMSADWLCASNLSDYAVDWGVGGKLVRFSWFAIVCMTVGIAFPMLLRSQRSYVPSTIPTAIALCAAVALVGVVLVLHRASDLTGADLEYRYLSAGYSDVTASNEVWFMLVGFISIVGSSMALRKLARVTRENAALALVEQL